MSLNPQRLADFKIKQIRKLRREGRSIREIAHISGVAKVTVEKYLKLPFLPLAGDSPQAERDT